MTFASRTSPNIVGASFISWVWPGESSTRTGLPSASTIAWIFVDGPPREGPISWEPPFSAPRMRPDAPARWSRRGGSSRRHARGRAPPRATQGHPTPTTATTACTPIARDRTQSEDRATGRPFEGSRASPRPSADEAWRCGLPSSLPEEAATRCASTARREAGTDGPPLTHDTVAPRLTASSAPRAARCRTQVDRTHFRVFPRCVYSSLRAGSRSCAPRGRGRARDPALWMPWGRCSGDAATGCWSCLLSCVRVRRWLSLVEHWCRYSVRQMRQDLLRASRA